MQTRKTRALLSVKDMNMCRIHIVVELAIDMMLVVDSLPWVSSLQLESSCNCYLLMLLSTMVLMENNLSTLIYHVDRMKHRRTRFKLDNNVLLTDTCRKLCTV
jgi:hypothetical protein